MSLLTSFEASTLFEAAKAIAKLGLKPKTNHLNQVLQSQACQNLHFVLDRSDIYIAFFVLVDKPIFRYTVCDRLWPSKPCCRACKYGLGLVFTWLMPYFNICAIFFTFVKDRANL